MHSGSDFTEELILVEAKSYVDRAEEINRKIATVQAKRNAFPFLAVLTFGSVLAASVFCGITLDNHFKREALINQENISHVARR